MAERYRGSYGGGGAPAEQAAPLSCRSSEIKRPKKARCYVALMALQGERAPPPMEPGHESGEGELEMSVEALGSSTRRGDKSIRERNLTALHEAAFPPYPLTQPETEHFDLPTSFIDAEAPASARKWCAAAQRALGDEHVIACISPPRRSRRVASILRLPPMRPHPLIN